MTPRLRRQLEILTPAGVTFLAVLGGVLASPLIGKIGWLAKPCSLRATTGLPCLACGGTRAVQALARGEWLMALKFNPLVVVGVVAVVIWFVTAIYRAWRWDPATKGTKPQGRTKRVRWILSVLGIAVVANWIYLWKYLPV